MTGSDSTPRGDQARAEILDAARQLFLSSGFHGTSMRAIARAAGDRAVAGLYNHFPTKDAIFVALIEERNPYDDLFTALEGAVEGAETAPEFVRRGLRAVLNVMPQHYDFIQLAQIDMREFEGQHMRHVLQDTILPRILALIERLQQLPGFKPLNPFVWLRLMGSLVIGFLVTDQIAPGTPFGMYDHDQWADLLTEALLYGIADADFEDSDPHVPES